MIWLDCFAFKNAFEMLHSIFSKVFRPAGRKTIKSARMKGLKVTD